MSSVFSLPDSFRPNEQTHRLQLQTEPNNRGIRYHGATWAFFQNIFSHLRICSPTIKVTYQERTFYMNKKSCANWLMVHQQPSYIKEKDNALIERMEHIAQKSTIFFPSPKPSTSKPAELNTQPSSAPTVPSLHGKGFHREPLEKQYEQFEEQQKNLENEEEQTPDGEEQPSATSFSSPPPSEEELSAPTEEPSRSSPPPSEHPETNETLPQHLSSSPTTPKSFPAYLPSTKPPPPSSPPPSQQSENNTLTTTPPASSSTDPSPKSPQNVPKNQESDDSHPNSKRIPIGKNLKNLAKRVTGNTGKSKKEATDPENKTKTRGLGKLFGKKSKQEKNSGSLVNSSGSLSEVSSQDEEDSDSYEALDSAEESPENIPGNGEQIRNAEVLLVDDSTRKEPPLEEAEVEEEVEEEQEKISQQKFQKLRHYISSQYPEFDLSLYNDIVFFQKAGLPLHFAVQKQDIELLKALVEAGADIHQQNENGNTILDILVSCTNVYNKETKSFFTVYYDKKTKKMIEFAIKKDSRKSATPYIEGIIEFCPEEQEAQDWVSDLIESTVCPENVAVIAHAIVDNEHLPNGILEKLFNENELHADALDAEERSLLYKAVNNMDKALVAALMRHKANPNLAIRNIQVKTEGPQVVWAKTPLDLALEKKSFLTTREEKVDPKDQDEPLVFLKAQGQDLAECNAIIELLKGKPS